MNPDAPLAIMDARALRGPNLYASRPKWRLAVQAAGLKLPPMDALTRAGLRIDDADPGRLIGSLAVALQNAAGIDAQEYQCEAGTNGEWVVVYDHEFEGAADEAGRQALALVQAVCTDQPPDVDEAVEAIRRRHAEDAPPPSVAALVGAARVRGIPVLRLTPRHHQLGWGHKQQQLWGSVPGNLSSLGYDSAHDHERTLEVLEDTGIPIPAGASADSLEDCRSAAAQIGYPVAIKPLRGRGGVTTNIRSQAEMDDAFERAKQLDRWVFVQKHVPGISHRVLVVAGEVIAAARVSDKKDVTATLHPSVALACRRAARLMGIEVVSVDVVAQTLEVPLESSQGKVVSLHPEPDLEPFLERGAAQKIIERLFPEGNGRIPLVAVTGTNGKTTVVRLIAHILKYARARVGMAVTGALEVENQVILRGDYSGPTAAQTVLREPGVTHAVCEVARGGILRRGLGFDACDVAVMLNVSRDHLGEGGIETLEDLARLKSVVLRAARQTGVLVLNADDPLVWGLRKTIPRNVIPFTLDPEHPDVQAHLAEDPHHIAVTLRDGAIIVRRGAVEFQGPQVVDIPLTLEGAAVFNIQNAMAATAVACALGIRDEDTRAGLLTFNPSMNQLPGRMNLMQIGEVKVLVDYGHNVAAVEALAPVLARLTKGQKINVAGGAGNRTDKDLQAFGATIGKMYDRIYLADADPRGRAPGDTPRQLAKGILSAGFPENKLVIEDDEMKVTRMAIDAARPGDLVVLQADDVEGVIRLCRELAAEQQSAKQSSDPAKP